MYSKPISLYSEILTNLFMGGTDDEDVIHIPARIYSRREDLPFDSIVTMYAWARPADWNVQEFRYGVPDASIKDIDLNRLRQAVEFGYDRWKQGDRLLVRCQAGLNRSGLVMALILIKDGYTPYQAIDLIRQRRTDIALFNENFVNWLLSSGANFINTDLRATA
jgi:protein-tyrosine phosphatase